MGSLAICFIKLFLIKIERYNRFIYIIEVLNMIVNTGKVYFTRLLYMNSKFLINFICISKKTWGLFGMDNEKNKAVRKNNKKKFKSNFFGKSDLRQTRTRANKIRKNNSKKIIMINYILNFLKRVLGILWAYVAIIPLKFYEKIVILCIEKKNQILRRLGDLYIEKKNQILRRL